MTNEGLAALTTAKLRPIPKGLAPTLWQLLLVLLFAGALSLAYLDHAYYAITWVAFVPLLLAIDKTSYIKTYFLTLIAGLVLFALGTYWIVDFVMLSKGFSPSQSLGLALLYWFYCAHLLAGITLAFKWLQMHSSCHEFMLFPLVVVAFTAGYPMLFSLNLGDTQAQFYVAIQAIDLLGVHGLDGILALTNIMVFRLITNLMTGNIASVKSNIWPWICAISVITLWFGYGAKQYRAWEERTATWERLKVGLVQPNEIPELNKRTLYSGYGLAFPPELDMTQRLSALGVDIVVWPEGQRKEFLDNPYVQSAYQASLESLDLGLIFQDTQQVSDPLTGNLTSQFNTAVMLDNSGQQIGTYQKIKRIPFGEYTPFFSEGSAARNWLDGFLGDFVNELNQGQQPQVFLYHKVNVIPLICYETSFPAFVGQAVESVSASRNPELGTVLVGLSNDGWFGATHQPLQHIMTSALRAVENRLPLVHAANNGPSIVASPSGRVIFTSDLQQAGGYAVDVPVSNSTYGSFYSRYPNLMTYTCYMLLGFVVLRVMMKRVRSFLFT